MNSTTPSDNGYGHQAIALDKSEEKKSLFRRLIHTYVPSNFHNIGGLAWRLLTEGKPAGRVAMVYSLLGIVLTPLDMFMQLFEKKLYAKAGQPSLPQIFVCGAARSGTTLVGQVLIKNLPVFFFNNLTSLFPRSPITAMKWFGWMAKGGKKRINYRSFYGRTSHISLPNDALYFWDKWTHHDRKNIPQSFPKEVQEEMINFFGAFDTYSGQPLVCKNNSLNTYAHLVAEFVDNSYFICLDRDPVFLAQSHYNARKFIHGSESVGYGIGTPEDFGARGIDPVEDICRQVMFHKKTIARQQEIIGPDRFIIVPYEDFCANPADWAHRIAAHVLKINLDKDALEKEIPPFKVSNKQKVDDKTYAEIKRHIASLSSESQTVS